jgi:Tfp pilus assembly protein PilF
VRTSSSSSRGCGALAGRAAGSAALLAAALLAACAGAQKPASVEVTPVATEVAAAPAAPADRQDQAAAEAGPPGAAAEPGGAAGRVAAAPSARSKATPDVQQRARAAFGEGVRLERAGDLAAAAAAFDRAAAIDPELSWASFNAGLLRERVGDDGGAVAAYERAIEARPDFAPAAQNLARVWVRQGKLAEAERELRDRLAKEDGVALRVGLAEVLLAGGNLEGAEAESRAALKADEKNLCAMVVLATTYSRKKRFELARMVLENARQVDGADPAVWNRLGFVEMALGNRVQAIEHFRTAAALRPDYPEAHANYGSMLADADDFAGAVQELELAVKYGPRSAGAWLNLGNAYRGLQQFEKAEQAYQKAQELDPALNDVSFNLAVLYLDVEKPGQPTLQRLEQGVQHFDAYERKGGAETRVAAYRKDAAREIDREKKRLAREEKDRARKEAEARRKADEDARRLAEEAAARREQEAKRIEEEARVAQAAAAAAQAAAAAPAPAPGASPPPAVQAAPRAPDPAPPGSEAQPTAPTPEPAPAAAPGTSTPAPATAATPSTPPAAGKLGEERGDK